MLYTNLCPILLEPLTKENAFLIKVPKLNDEEKDTYYYIGDEKTLEKFSSCPFTRRQGNYYALKLSSQIFDNKKPKDVASKLQGINQSTLIEDNDALAKIDKENKFKWQLRTFRNNVINYNTGTTHQDLLAFTDNLNNENEIEASSARVLPSNRQIISDYKADVFRHPSPPMRILEVMLRPNSFARLQRIMRQLMDNALLEEHDLIFLISSYRLISNLEESQHKIALQNAIYAQLARYVEGFLVLTSIISIGIDLFNNGFSSSTYFGILKILLIDRVQDNFQFLCRLNEHLDATSIAQSILDVPIQLTHPSIIYASTRSAASNSYEFVKTNLSFFHNKYIKSNPTQYELPEDLANIQRQLSQ